MKAELTPPVIDHKTYLLNGKLIPWSGDVAEVRSPILPSDASKEDELRGVLLGSAPDMDEPSAIAALESAKSAYDFGR